MTGIPSAREGLEDKLRTIIERHNDRRLREHHAIRSIHKKSGTVCACDGETFPCRTLLAIDGAAI